MIGTETPLIWSESEQDSELLMVGPMLDLCWKMVHWLMYDKADISYYEPV